VIFVEQFLEKEDYGNDEKQKIDVDSGKDFNEYKNKFLRIKADFENYKKRVEKEREELANYIKREIFKSILPIIDDIEKCMKHNSDEYQSFREGIELIYKKIENMLKVNGLKKIPSKGEKFDHNFHEAIMVKPVYQEELDDVILDVVQTGYTINNILLRPARVIVGRYDEKSKSDLTSG